jgi:hypothetical protein
VDNVGCLDRDKLVETLGREFGEVKVAQGLTEDGRVLEIFSSEETGTWTATVSDSFGKTCPRVNGGFWVHIPPEEPNL